VFALNNPVNLNDPNGLQEAQCAAEALIKALDIAVDGTRKKNNEKKLDDAVAHCGPHLMRLSLLVLRSVSCSY
jgi:hypothetical protein